MFNHKLAHNQIWYNYISNKIFVCEYVEIQEIFIFSHGTDSYFMNDKFMNTVRGWHFLGDL